MRVLLVHNEYARFSGEEAVVYGLRDLLGARGHEVRCLIRSSRELLGRPWATARAFFSGIYSFESRRRLRGLLGEFRPDVVHVHNLYPLLSPSVLVEFARRRLPVVMTVHNYRLVCPTGLFMKDGRVCERCAGGREWWCFLHDCESSRLKSLGYALRSYWARRRGYYRRHVTMYAALTEFQRLRLVREGFPPERIAVVPNAVDPRPAAPAAALGGHVGYVGRISAEKGIETLLAAARRCPDVPFRAAGAGDDIGRLTRQAPPNLTFCGHLPAEKLPAFYAASRIIVLPSLCYEGFPTVLAEAMLRGRPVVCSRIGGLGEIVDDGVTGLLFDPGSADDLAEKVRRLWDAPGDGRRMGLAGRRKALREYTPSRQYARLMGVYERAIHLRSRAARLRAA